MIPALDVIARKDWLNVKSAPFGAKVSALLFACVAYAVTAPFVVKTSSITRLPPV